MSKRNKIIYWIATAWLSLGMVSTGIVQLLKVKDEVDFILLLGYPAYFLTLIGVAKILGVVAVLIPKFPLLKEWAYAGFTFNFISAFVSHTAVDGMGMQSVFPLFALLILAGSYFYYNKIKAFAFTGGKNKSSYLQLSHA